MAAVGGIQSQIGTGINLTKGKTLCKFINSMLTWFERAESVFFRFPQLSVALTYEFKSALHRSGLLSRCSDLS